MLTIIDYQFTRHSKRHRVLFTQTKDSNMLKCMGYSNIDSTPADNGEIYRLLPLAPVEEVPTYDLLPSGVERFCSSQLDSL